MIICDGKLADAVASRNRLSEHDLLGDLRLHGNVARVRDVALAVFERSGHVSVVPRERRDAVHRSGDERANEARTSQSLTLLVGGQ